MTEDHGEGTDRVDPAPPDEGNSARRWRPVVLTLAPILALVSLFAFGLGRDPRSLPSTLVGRPAPDFALAEVSSGRVVRLADLRGQVVVVNFWASWCAGCRIEHDDLRAAWERYRERGMVLVGIVYQDSERNAEAYTDAFGGDWPTVLDPTSRTALDYGVVGIPETFFIGPDGTVAYKHVGESTYDVLVSWIDRLLRSPSSTAAIGGSG